jgi:hypothetical protein
MSYKTKIRFVVMIIEGANLAAVLIKHVAVRRLLKALLTFHYLLQALLL